MLQLPPSTGRFVRAVLVLLALTLTGSAAHAADTTGFERVDLPPLAKGEVVLQVDTPKGSLGYDLATLEELGLWRLTTKSLWDQDATTFEGVRLEDLLADAGLGATAAVEVTALDDYSQVIPRTDWETYTVLLATRQDGAPIVDRGPLRVVYPLSYHPELDDDLYHARWVWALKELKAVEP